MNIALWVVQGLLALAFLAVAGMKLFAYEKYKAMSERNVPSGLTRGLVAFIGVAELAGAIGIVLPMAAGIAPWLSAWAAVGLPTVMLLGNRLPRPSPRVASNASHSLCARSVCGLRALFSMEVSKNAGAAGTCADRATRMCCLTFANPQPPAGISNQYLQR
jgi:uncharacterized membrane protein